MEGNPEHVPVGNRTQRPQQQPQAGAVQVPEGSFKGRKDGSMVRWQPWLSHGRQGAPLHCHTREL
jgi:hypothetical protein